MTLPKRVPSVVDGMSLLEAGPDVKQAEAAVSLRISIDSRGLGVLQRGLVQSTGSGKIPDTVGPAIASIVVSLPQVACSGCQRSLLRKAPVGNVRAWTVREITDGYLAVLDRHDEPSCRTLTCPTSPSRWPSIEDIPEGALTDHVALSTVIRHTTDIDVDQS
jgi:hypothetical protein